MSHRSLHSFRWLALFVLLLVALPLSSPAHAAQPGEPLISRSGSLTGGQSLQDQTIYSFSGQANLRLDISGGSADETITAIVKDSGGAPITSFVGRNGETIWGTVTLPANARIALTNNSGVTLNFMLNVYAVDIAPSFAEGVGTWSGTSKSVGIQSAVTINMPSDGLYGFTLAASGGAYQFVVDNNYVRKTVVAGNVPNPSDTVYYLSAGAHTFSIVQDPASSVVTGWSVAVSPIGGSDVLPSNESASVLGGGSFFREEWIPLVVAEGATVDIRIEVAGSATDNLSMELLSGGTQVFSSTSVFGGEVAWASTSVAAGANALHIVTRNGNAASLAYNIQIQAVPQAPFSWSGVTYGQTNRPGEGSSSIQLNFPTSGLYTFAMAANSGRFQFMLADDYIQKTVTDTTSTALSAYVDAGTYTLKVAQDPQQPVTSWKIDIQPGSAATDTLPFVRQSGTLGKADNSAFDEEWLPLQSDAARPINLKIVAHGSANDSLRIELYNGSELKYTAATVYGGETFWAPADLVAGTNRLHIVATGTQMSYEATVAAIGDAPSSWAGMSDQKGLHSTAVLNAPVNGVYDVVMTVDEGEANLVVDNAAGTAAVNQIAANVVTLRVELAKGLHSFTVNQDASLARTSWSVTISLRRELPSDPNEPNNPTDPTDPTNPGTSYQVFLPVVQN